MSTVVGSGGKDTIILDGRVLRDLMNEDAISLTFPDSIADVETGKEGNSLFVQNFSGQKAELILRILIGTPDDRFLGGRLIEQNNDFSAFVLMNGSFTKLLGLGDGSSISKVYELQRGVFTKNVDVKFNAQGDTEQVVSIYTIKFALAVASIQ